MFWPLNLHRISLGLAFFSSGFNKLFVLKNQRLMLQNMIDAGILAPKFMAVFVAAVEAIFGLVLVFGFLMRLVAIPLLIIFIVALITVGIYQIPTGQGLFTWFSWGMYLPGSL